MTRFRVEVKDHPEHISGGFSTEDEAERFARSYAAVDRLVATVIDPTGQPLSIWEPHDLDGLTELQRSIYEYVRSKHDRTPPVGIDELATELQSSAEAVSEALTASLTERLLHLRPAAPGRDGWVALDGGSIDAAWRRPSSY